MAITESLQRIVALALAEDVGPGDVTSQAIIPPDTRLVGEFLVKAPGVIAGLEVVGEVFRQVDAELRYTPLVADGNMVAIGDIVARVEGSGPSILTAERVALNFLQRMSGIATMTRRFVDADAATGTRILYTRKTAPGLRELDKLAVALGGGMNHRFGLYDMVLIKDNHIQAAGSITEAVRRVRQRVTDLAIEVEVESLKQLDEALKLEVDRIMLDNMDAATMREAVQRARAHRAAGEGVELEASGGITLATVAEVAATGVDFISIGALTHSVVALDVSLEIKQAS